MISMCRKKIQDSQGPMTKKNLATIKELIEEFVKHSREYITRGKVSSNGASEEFTVVVAKLNNMNRRMTKMGQSIHVIQVGWDNCSIPHLKKDYDLDESGNQKGISMLLEW